MPKSLVKGADQPISASVDAVEPVDVSIHADHKGLPDPDPVFPAAGFDGFSSHGKLRTAFVAYELRGGLIRHDHVPEVANVVFTGPIGLRQVDEWLPLTAHGVFASEADVILFCQGREVQGADFGGQRLQLVPRAIVPMGEDRKGRQIVIVVYDICQICLGW